jgi:spore coat protein U-like protein
MRYARFALASLLAAGSSNAWAVLDSCEVSATSIPFGNYDPASTSPREVTGTVSVACLVLVIGLNVSWTLSLDDGLGTSFTPRRLSSGADTLNYNIYTSSSYGTIWGDGSPGTSTVSDSVFLIAGMTHRQYTMHARIPALQDVRPGSYGDSVVVSILY